MAAISGRAGVRIGCRSRARGPDRRLPHRRRAVPDRHGRRSRDPGRTVAGPAGAAPASPAPTRCGGCCATSRAATPTCTAASSSRPTTPARDLGALFWHKDGFSTACGHGTIALGAWAVDTGLVAAPADGETERGDRRAVGPGRRPRARGGRRGRGRRLPQRARRTCSRATSRSTRRAGGRRRRRLRRGDLRLACRPPPSGLAVDAGALRRADRGRPRDQAGAQRTGPRATRPTPAVRRLRHDLVRRPRRRRRAAPAQRHRLRRRRGGPVAVRLGHRARLALLHADGLAPGAGCATTRSSAPPSARASSDGPPTAGRGRHRGRRARPTAPASTVRARPRDPLGPGFVLR